MSASASLTPARPASPTLFHRSLLHPSPLVSTITPGTTSTLHLPTHNVLDFCGGAAVSALPLTPRILAAATNQLTTAPYVNTISYHTSSAASLSSLLLHPIPAFTRAFFCNSGSEAMEAALKLARQYHVERGETQRVHFISRRQSYHGNTLGALSVSGNRGRREAYEGVLLGNCSRVGDANVYRSECTDEELVQHLVAELEAEFRRVGEGKVVAFIAETVVGATLGAVPPPRGYFTAVKEVCERWGALLILDEVMCGMGRTGSMYAFQQESVTPDIVTIGKALGAGFIPLAGVLVNQHIVEVLRAGSGVFQHGHTFQAHPVACAAALAVQETIAEDNLHENVRNMGTTLEAALREALGAEKYIGDIRGRGLLWGVEFVADRETKEPFSADVGFGVRVQTRTYELGVALYPGTGTVDGVRGDHVILAPPFTVSTGDIVMAVEVLKRAYLEIAGEVESGVIKEVAKGF